jgi:hypothetical protein
VGKHVRRRVPLPPGAKPRHRFVIALGTIVLLAFGTMAAVAALHPRNGPQAAAGPEVEHPFSGTAGPAAPSGSGPTSGLLAVYTMPSDAVGNAAFQAQITMTNTTPTPQDWQVRLRYSNSITNVAGTWVDGQPQPISHVGGGAHYIFTGIAPVDPGQTVVFKVQFGTEPQANVVLSECTANGRPCQIT